VYILYSLMDATTIQGVVIQNSKNQNKCTLLGLPNKGGQHVSL